jgi:hypothetical protein
MLFNPTNIMISPHFGSVFLPAESSCGKGRDYLPNHQELPVAQRFIRVRLLKFLALAALQWSVMQCSCSFQQTDSNVHCLSAQLGGHSSHWTHGGLLRMETDKCGISPNSFFPLLSRSPHTLLAICGGETADLAAMWR